jgi:hypothetical protein
MCTHSYSQEIRSEGQWLFRSCQTFGQIGLKENGADILNMLNETGHFLTPLMAMNFIFKFFLNKLKMKCHSLIFMRGFHNTCSKFE